MPNFKKNNEDSDSDSKDDAIDLARFARGEGCDHQAGVHCVICD